MANVLPYNLFCVNYAVALRDPLDFRWQIDERENRGYILKVMHSYLMESPPFVIKN